ncbi:unnamed protein product [Prunus armeniaca]|uniref:Uncharacterized protein n=1 Tax=Prunus armeniaca TaxID=36596 RepID=A0A6J5Y3T2_PRUAR|nr:unnamed protein product [Prunus armeniaca]
MKRKLLRAGLRCNEFLVAIDFVASHPTFTAYVDFFAAKKSVARSLEANQERADISNMGNHIGLTITRDIEVEAAIDFKKVRMGWRPIRVWVCSNNPKENRRIKRKIHRTAFRCNEFLVAIDFVASHPTFTAYVDLFSAKKSAAHSFQ